MSTSAAATISGPTGPQGISYPVTARTTLDANHIYGWWFADASGSTFSAAAGAVTMTVASSVLADTGMWRNYNCALNDGSRYPTTNSLSIAYNQDYTLEVFLQTEPNTFRYPAGTQNLFFFDANDAQNGVVAFGSGGNFTVRALIAGIATDTTLGSGGGWSNSLPNHLMVTWTGGATGTVNVYVNGELFNTFTKSQRAAGKTITRLLTMNEATGSRWGGVLVSNTIRSITYARAQTQLMRKW